MATRKPVRHIIHADMDAFYASIEQLDNPTLRSKPVLVGGAPDARGVVAAASYEARVFGCRSAMPMKIAVRLCPQAVCVVPHFTRYRQISEQIMTIFRRLTPLVEPLSLDEAFLDVTHRVERGQAPEVVARWIKDTVQAETRLTVSCGVATAKSLAKIACGMEKPDGLTVVPPGEERAFLAPLSVGDLWGVGPKTTMRFERAGITTIGELAERPLPWLIDRFGVRGEWFHQLAIGADDSSVSPTRERKSISSESTFAEDSRDRDQLERVVREQAASVARQLRRSGLRARTVQVKLRLSDFTTFTRRHTVALATDEENLIAAEAVALLERELTPGRKFRLVGVGVSNLSEPEAAGQLGLFDYHVSEDASELERGPQHPAELDAAVTEIRDRYGATAIAWGDAD
jgi:DNA polymerase-4